MNGWMEVIEFLFEFILYISGECRYYDIVRV